MEDDLKKRIEETLIKIKEILTPELMSNIDDKINEQLKIIENTLITRRESTDLDPATRDIIDSFKQILDSNSRSIKKEIESEIGHIFLVLSKELQKISAIFYLRTLKLDRGERELNIFLQDLPKSFSQSIEYTLMRVIKEFQTIDKNLREAPDSPTLLINIQDLTIQQQKKIDSFQKEIVRDIKDSMKSRTKLKQITAFIIREQRKQG